VAFLALFYGVMLLASQALVLGATRLAAASRLLTRIVQIGSALLMWLFAESYLWQGLTELFG
jgi:putative Ca2+/H+ antiporter (TMEM165/GDT1 family)